MFLKYAYTHLGACLRITSLAMKCGVGHSTAYFWLICFYGRWRPLSRNLDSQLPLVLTLTQSW